MKDMKNKIQYRFFKKSGIVQGAFAVFLLISLFAPTSFIFTISALNLDSVNQVEADDFGGDWGFDFADFGTQSDAADNYYYGGDSSNYYGSWGYDSGSYDYSAGSDAADNYYYGGDSSNYYGSWGYDSGSYDYSAGSDAADNYYYGGSNESFETTWNNIIGDYTNSNSSSAYWNSNNFLQVSDGGTSNNEVNPIGGDQAEEVNPIGGDQAEEVNPIGGDQSEDQFPWWLGLLAIPALIGGGSDNNTSAPPTPGVCVPVNITNSLVASGNVGSMFSFSLGATGSNPISWNVSGLPDGLSFNGSMISGVPTTAGTYSVTLSATNACGSDTETLVITIAPVGVCLPANYPAFTSPTNASGVVGNAFAHVFSATGNTPITYSVNNLPSGLSLQGDRIVGTPTTAGTYTITVNATNNCGTVSQTLTIVIAPVGGVCIPGIPVVTNDTVVVGMGQNLNYQIQATNNPTTYGATPLPQGFTLATSTGVISGSPFTTGTYTITISATNNCGTGSNSLTISTPGGNPPTNPPTGGGGGGTSGPDVTLLSSAGASPLASSVYVGESPYGLYLSQIPYTGLGDALKTLLFLVAVFVIAILASYVSVYGRSKEGISAISMVTDSYERIAEIVIAFVSTLEVYEDKLQKLIGSAREQGAILTLDGAKIILGVAEEDLFKAYPILADVLFAVVEGTPESQMPIITITKVREVLNNVFMEFVPVYAMWMKNGETTKMNKFIAKLEMNGFSGRDFLLNVSRETNLAESFGLA